MFEPAASKVAHFPAFDHAGPAHTQVLYPRHAVQGSWGEQVRPLTATPEPELEPEPKPKPTPTPTPSLTPTPYPYPYPYSYPYP